MGIKTKESEIMSCRMKNDIHSCCDGKNIIDLDEFEINEQIIDKGTIVGHKENKIKVWGCKKCQIVYL